MNVNADDAAAAIAHALDAAELLYLTDVAGVLDAGTVVAELDVVRAEALVSGGIATGGMAVKVQASLAALKTGVPAARIGGLEMMSSGIAGTRLSASVGVCA